MHDGRFGSMNEHQRQRTTKIIDSAQYLSDLVGELLDMSRGLAGTLKLELERISPTALISEISDELRPMVEEKGLNFDVRFDPTTPHFVVTDLSKMRQIVTNLVTNAVKFTEQGHIRVAARGGPDSRLAAHN